MPSTPDGSPGFPGSAAAAAITRHAVIVITCVIAATSFAFSFCNVADLCLRVGIPQPLAWLVSPPVDLSVTGLLLGLSILSQRHCADEESRKRLRTLLRKLRLMLLGCGALTIALNTSGAAIRGQLGAALVDAILLTLLILWSEAGPPLIRELTAITQLAQPTRQQAAQEEKAEEEPTDKPAGKTPPALHPELIEQASTRRSVPPGPPGQADLTRQPAV